MLTDWQHTFSIIFVIMYLGTFNSLGDTSISLRNGGDNMIKKENSFKNIIIICLLILLFVSLVTNFISLI